MPVFIKCKKCNLFYEKFDNQSCYDEFKECNEHKNKKEWLKW